MQNHTIWLLALIASVALTAAILVGVNGCRQAPLPRVDALTAGTARGSDTDPLAPRLFDKTATIRIHVAGAVRKPNVYAIPAWFRVADAIKRAGGATPAADLDAINLADTLQDGEQLRVPYRGRPSQLTDHLPTPSPERTPRTSGGRGVGRYPFASTLTTTREPPADSGDAEALPALPVNLNTASAADLERLPGVGPETAAAIIADRTDNGPFSSPEDLQRVKGIGPTRFARLRPFIATP